MTIPNLGQHIKNAGKQVNPAYKNLATNTGNLYTNAQSATDAAVKAEFLKRGIMDASLYGQEKDQTAKAMSLGKGAALSAVGQQRRGDVLNLGTNMYEDKLNQYQADQEASMQKQLLKAQFQAQLRQIAAEKAAAAAAAAGYGGYGQGQITDTPAGGGAVDWNAVIRQAQKESSDGSWGSTAAIMAKYYNIKSGAGQKAMDAYFGGGKTTRGQWEKQDSNRSNLNQDSNRSNLNKGFLWGR